MLREYIEQDWDDLLSAWETASSVAHPFLTKEFLELERQNISNLYLPNAETWVAENDGHVVGFVSLLGNEVGGLFVHSSHHRKGIGCSLIDKARELKGELYVEVFKDNKIGRAFYDQYGFSRLGEKVHEQTGLDLICLQLTT